MTHLAGLDQKTRQAWREAAIDWRAERDRPDRASAPRLAAPPPDEGDSDRACEDRPVTFNTVLGIARAVATAAPEKRVAMTGWASRVMAENVRAGKISADLAHRVLFEAAMRSGLPATEAGSIIENAFRSNSRG
jgi:hypothetical protein